MAAEADGLAVGFVGLAVAMAGLAGARVRARA